MSKRRNLERKRQQKMRRAAYGIVSKLTIEQQDRLAETLAKAVLNVGHSDTTATKTAR